MATKIETLKKPNGDQVLPRTRAKAVSLENGTSVETAIEDINAITNNAILHSSQNLTESQKAQARANIGAAQIGETSSALPEVAPSDAGKFLVVSSAGEWVAESVLMAEEVEF